MEQAVHELKIANDKGVMEYRYVTMHEGVLVDLKPYGNKLPDSFEEVPYDSAADTLAHILKVNEFLNMVVAELLRRGIVHDQSKLGPNEKPHFDRASKKLAKLTYGTEEYRASLADLREGLNHHYANNSHHPEYYKHGVAGMSLIDIVEMFCDWCAASLRTKGGKLDLETSFERFKFDPQLANIFRNTAKHLNIPTVEGMHDAG